MKKIYIHQPDFIPPLNFFLRAKRSDIFVILDDVLLNRSGWTNRDLIRTKSGIKKLTVPIQYIERDKAFIKSVKISNEKSWNKKILNQIHENYKDSKFYNQNMQILKSGFDKKFEKIIDLNLYFIKVYFKIFDIKTKLIFSSKLNIKSSKSNKILDICKLLQATEYITGEGSKNYLINETFESNKIKINYNISLKKSYNQIGEKFISNLSAIDYLFNCCNGKSSNFLNE